MRRTLALLGVAALAVAGLAGTANASEGAVGNLEFAQTELDGTGVHPGTTTNPTDAYFELQTIDGATPASLAGMSVEACIGANPSPVVLVAAYPSGVEVGATQIFRTADPNFSGISDIEWDPSASGDLDSVDFDIVLLDGAAVVARTQHGAPDCSPV